jgi:UDP-N-acetylglucosamine:LPS N-acetylglucosamine transferase
VSKTILISAGGGGHTGYAFALAQRLYGRVNLRFLVPEGDVLSQRRLSKFGDVYFLLKARGAKTSNAQLIPRLAKAFFDSLRQVASECNAVVSTGSNFSIPPAFVARLKGIPLINIESSVRFTKASKTARILQPFSTITVLHWDEQRKLLRKGVVVGPLLPKPQVKQWNGGYILVTGGTLGHKLLFDTISESSLDNVVLQTGQIDSKPYAKRHPKWKVIRFSTTFYELVAGAELVVTHFGSTALEAVVYRKPMVLVLNPEWKRTVGKTDAEIFANKVKAAFLWDVTFPNLEKAMDDAKNMQLPIFEDGAEKLAELILRL